MRKILLVDDIEAELQLLNNYLTEGGYQVVTALSGKEALEKVSKESFDVIVTDWMMPGMGGLDLCRKLKKKSETANIPVIACTAKDGDVDKMWAKKQGISRYVVKPCTQEELVHTVKTVVG